MTDPEILDLALRTALVVLATASLGVAIAALRTVRAGIAAMAANAAQRAAEHTQRHAQTMAALDAQRRALETLIARTAPAGDPARVPPSAHTD